MDWIAQASMSIASFPWYPTGVAYSADLAKMEKQSDIDMRARAC